MIILKGSFAFRFFVMITNAISIGLGAGIALSNAPLGTILILLNTAAMIIPILSIKWVSERTFEKMLEREGKGNKV